jgi:hypothetical protein
LLTKMSGFPVVVRPLNDIPLSLLYVLLCAPIQHLFISHNLAQIPRQQCR